MYSLEVSHLQAGYGDRIVLDDISMSVEQGEIRVILGGSGSGKSTLLNNILGLEIPKSGSVRILDNEVSYIEGVPEAVRKKTGVLFQSSALISSLTVGENVSLPLIMHQKDFPSSLAEAMAAQCLERVGLNNAFYKLPSQLSGGMKKRAGLARALVTEPALLFCDEPSAGLDPVSSRELDELLLSLNENLSLSIIVVTHELYSIHAICDKLLFLSGGKVIFDGALSDAIAQGPEEVKLFFKRDSRRSQSVLSTSGASSTSFGQS